MLIFTSPQLSSGSLQYALARKPNNQLVLIFARAYGMLETRESAILNFTTPHSQKPQLSAENRLLIWLDSDVDRDDREFVKPPGGMLAALLAADPPIISTTGRTKMMSSAEGREREAVEVELMMSVDDLARICYYCHAIETDVDAREARFQVCGGDGFETQYCCNSCSTSSGIRRFAMSLSNTLEAVIQSYRS
ncbi:hypothetical protein GALMADRAFT_228722 [Galerina marginata CBS 339.88]|uniref:Uncharacterized protein n=1 Tax=Galerina marginata (strain CBS 339.88) TaxID=685588 RepID=A0A067SSM6_GALM3|nr:hypothetical protein GALMADRAFT_228722 [Galerina marginata CBS 339.88]